MTTTVNIKKFYNILEVPPGCSWDMLRQSYKRQIQKYHPDRFADGTASKIEAEKRIKLLNSAYQYFLKYYREHQSLPSTLKPESAVNNPEPDLNNKPGRDFSFDPMDTFSETSSSHKNTLHPREYARQFIIISSLITIIVFLNIFDFKEETTNHINIDAPDNSAYEEDSTLDNKPLMKKADISVINSHTLIPRHPNELSDPEYSISLNKLKDTKKQYFTYGSSMGHVLDAQGIPDRTTNDTWYYGQSTVLFENGLVIAWHRHHESPLYIDLSSNPEHAIPGSNIDDNVKSLDESQIQY